jgi:hypothetical protein
MTGDWGRTRSELKEKGVKMELALTGFVQSAAEGGIETGSIDSPSSKRCSNSILESSRV